MKLIILILLFTQNLLAQDILISWKAPVEREDNTALLISEIKQFNIYWGLASGDYQNTIPINLNFATSYDFVSAPSKTLYFVMTTIDTDGRESVYSPEVMIDLIDVAPDMPNNIRIHFN